MFTRLFDTLIREPQLIVKYYLPVKFGRTDGRMVFMADGRFPHGGMFDRLKGAMSVYAASKVLGRRFCISFTHPFDLRKYLEPNAYDWTIDNSCMEWNWPRATPIFMYGEFSSPRRLLKKRHGEAHFYYGYDSLEFINDTCGTHYEFGELYRELFRPTPLLQEHLDAQKSVVGAGYIAIHFRFMNLIGDTTEFAGINPTLPPAEQDVLIRKSLGQLRALAARHSGCRIMLATDSSRFRRIALEQIPDLYTVPGIIRHIGTATDNSDDSDLKMFVDYYMMAGAQKIYNLVSNGMWKSAFPEYAAKIGDKPFERIFY